MNETHRCRTRTLLLGTVHENLLAICTHRLEELGAEPGVLDHRPEAHERAGRRERGRGRERGDGGDLRARASVSGLSWIRTRATTHLLEGAICRDEGGERGGDALVEPVEGRVLGVQLLHKLCRTLEGEVEVGKHAQSWLSGG